MAKRTKRTKRASRKTSAKKVAPRRQPGFAAAPTSSRVPPPLTGVPRDQVGANVQRFIDFDGVRLIQADEEPPGATFTVTPLA
jgi:hypothetical protein